MGLAAVDDPLRAHLKLPGDQGLVVTALDPHSPAALAGIRQNDVLLKLGETALGKPGDLDEALKAAGDKPAPLSLLRHGKPLTLKVQPRVRVTLGPVQPEPPALWIGVTVAPIEPALRAHLDLPQKQGLLAVEVVKDGPAARADVRAHDILLSLDGEALRDQAKLIELVQAKGGKALSLELVREGKKRTVEITPQRRKSFRVTWHADPPTTLRYEVIHPGAVLGAARDGGGNTGSGAVTGDFDRDGILDVFTVPGRVSSAKESQEGGTSTSRRLDDLAAQVKQLRQAIEALTKAAPEKE
jgi:membrane-associated protease RseP (regulator of RpoE activity)